MRSIHIYVGDTRRKAVFLFCIRQLMLAAVFTWGLFILWGIADYLLTLPFLYRRLFLAAAALTALYAVLRCAHLHLLLLRNPARIIKLIQNKIPALGDELLSAWQLYTNSGAGVSGELINALSLKVEKILAGVPSKNILSLQENIRLPLRLFAVVLAITIWCLALPPYLLRGAPARIINPSAKDTAVSLQTTASQAAFPQFGDFKITFRHPQYTGIAEHTISGNPAIAAIAGTVVEISARSSIALANANIIAPGGTSIPCTIKNDAITASFTISNSGNWHIAAESESGFADPQPPEYPVIVTPDRPPEINLLSPLDDLVIAPEVELPLVVEAHDDFGITKMVLNYQTGDGNTHRALIPLTRGSGDNIVEYTWDTTKLGLTAGARVSYFIEAWDNDTVTGPKSAVTNTMSLQCADYLQEHDAIEKELEAFRDMLLNVLADQTMARESLKEIQTSFSTATWNNLTERQNDIRAKTETAQNSLNGILSRMERDPCTDFSTFNEYKGLSSHIEHLKDNPMREASQALQNKDLERAGVNQDEIISGLEKMGVLAQDIWQYQRMRDLFESGADLEKNAGDLVNQLSGAPVPEELVKTLKNIENLIDKIQRQLAKLPQELPEDFINSPAVKQIDMQKTRALSDELSDAVKRGDWARARELASSLQKNLASLLETMQEAGSDVGFSKDAAGKMQEELSARRQQLDDIISRQEKVTAAAGQLEETRKQALFSVQEKSLTKLYLKQKAITERAKTTIPGMRSRLPDKAFPCEQTLSLMQKVTDEFRSRRAYNSQKFLSDIISAWEPAAAGSQSLPAGDPLQADISFVLSGEKEILENLRSPQEGELLNENELGQLQKLRAEQGAVEEKTRDLHKSLQEFTRKSAAIAPDTFNNLKSAAGEMAASAREMDARNTAGAAESCRKALEHLQAGKDGMAGAQESMSGHGQNSGTPVAGPVQMRSGGSAGMRSAPVKLPRAADYKPPREFRQEILDALKEKYPAQYEKIIKEYYRKLTE